jgi:hypothetical protein
MADGLGLPLNKFIGDSLKQIIDGVLDAQKFAQKHDARINPNGLQHSKDRLFWDPASGTSLERSAQLVEFDLAVTVQEGKKARGGVGVMLAVMGLGAELKGETSSLAISRIKFSVPLVLPQQKVEEKTEEASSGESHADARR